jgi:hypothetical protein
MKDEKNASGIKNNKGKFTLLIIYILIAFVIPFSGHLPVVGNLIKQNAQSFVPKNIDPFFQQYIRELQVGNVNKIFSLMTPQARQQISTSSVQQLSALFASTTAQMEGITLNVNRVAGQGTYYDVTYEIKNNDPTYKYLLAEIAAQNTGNGIQVDSVHVTGETQSILEQGKFNFAHQFPYLLASILLPLFVVYTGLRYLFKVQKPGWILFLVILLLSVYLNIVYQAGNITTGLTIGVYGATYQSSLGYWVYMMPIPLGSIYYWIRRKHYENHFPILVSTDSS